MSPSEKSHKRMVENTIPVLEVGDLQNSIRFYTETLGFKADWPVRG